MNESLYFKEGSSDKVYNVVLEESGSGYVVNFTYGRRGFALTSGTKTANAVTYDIAKNIYDKLIKEKKAKGYISGTIDVVYTSTTTSKLLDILPQLLNSISESEAKILLEKDQYYMQQKMDGRRIIISVSLDKVTAFNRKGIEVDIPLPVSITLQEMIKKSLISCILDGELIGNCYYAFDIINKSIIFSKRYNLLCQLTPYQTENFQIVYAAINMTAKCKLFAYLEEINAEGVVFKYMDAFYTPGRPNSLGSQLKYKFYDTCSAVVQSINLQRSVNLSIEGTPVGAVTILPNFDIPEVGTVVEIRYLYYNKGGSLYQPVYLGERDDILAEECKISQLKERKI